jgi:hypothetical protein
MISIDIALIVVFVSGYLIGAAAEIVRAKWSSPA